MKSTLKVEPGRYPINNLYPFLSISISYLLIIAAIALCVGWSWWLYPIALLLLINRFVGFMFLSHEAVHGAFHTNRRINDFLGRFLCCIPILMSFSKFKRTHLRHHMYLNRPIHDPNHIVAEYFPVRLRTLFLRRFSSLLTLKLFRAFMWDNSEIYEIFYKYTGKAGLAPKDSEHFFFLAYLFLLVVATAIFPVEMLGLYWIPLVLFQVYIVLMTGLQHSPIRELETNGGPSRNIVGSPISMTLLLPHYVNLHGTHHFAPTVPCYRLPALTEDLQNEQGISFWTQNYWSSLKDLFTVPIDKPSN